MTTRTTISTQPQYDATELQKRLEDTEKVLADFLAAQGIDSATEDLVKFVAWVLANKESNTVAKMIFDMAPSMIRMEVVEKLLNKVPPPEPGRNIFDGWFWWSENTPAWVSAGVGLPRGESPSLDLLPRASAGLPRPNRNQPLPLRSLPPQANPRHWGGRWG